MAGLQQTFNFTTATYSNLDDLDKAWSNCTKCNLRRHRGCVTHGVGNRVEPLVMVIGQYPTEKETEDGIPFRGRGGELIRDFFQKAGLKDEEIYFTNVIKCPTFGTRAIPKNCMQACSPYLDDEIGILRPKLIIGMGTQATARLLKTVKPKPKTVAEARSRDWNFEGIHTLIITNPVAVVHAKDVVDRQAKERIYEEDLARVRDAVAVAKGAQMVDIQRQEDAKDIFDLYDTVLACNRCPIGQSCTTRVFGSGPLNAKIVLVGEGPGRQEDGEGNPFVGPAGRKLSEAIERAKEESGIDEVVRENIYFANVAKCRPTNASGGDRAPNTEERSNCAGYLFKQIKLIKPKIVLAVGRIAMETLWGVQVKRVGDRVNTRAPFCADESVSVIGTWHPSYVLRKQGNPGPMNDLVRGITLAFEGAYGHPISS